MINDKPAVVVGIGELIWDLLPNGKQLGGATTNFAYISHLLGNMSFVASRVGDDELGLEARSRLDRMGIVTKYLQVDRRHPTGTVGIEIDKCGEAHYAMNEDSAWDYLAWTESLAELASRADAVCYGTMAQREPGSRATILRFIEHSRPEALRIFDVNLRHAFFNAEMLAASLARATIVKLNDDELNRISEMLGLDSGRDESLALQMLEEFNIELVAVTRGSRGSTLVTKDDEVNHPGIPVNVVDSIGSGDAFTAALAHYYLRRAPLKIVSEAANRIGSWVATQSGATPKANNETLERILGDLDSRDRN